MVLHAQISVPNFACDTTFVSSFSPEWASTAQSNLYNPLRSPAGWYLAINDRLPADPQGRLQRIQHLSFKAHVKSGFNLALRWVHRNQLVMYCGDWPRPAERRVVVVPKPKARLEVPDTPTEVAITAPHSIPQSEIAQAVGLLGRYESLIRDEKEDLLSKDHLVYHVKYSDKRSVALAKNLRLNASHGEELAFHTNYAEAEKIQNDILGQNNGGALTRIKYAMAHLASREQLLKLPYCKYGGQADPAPRQE